MSAEKCQLYFRIDSTKLFIAPQVKDQRLIALIINKLTSKLELKEFIAALYQSCLNYKQYIQMQIIALSNAQCNIGNGADVNYFTVLGPTTNNPQRIQLNKNLKSKKPPIIFDIFSF